jgi:hypothetical protein
MVGDALLGCTIFSAYPWTTLVEDYLLKWGPVLKAGKAAFLFHEEHQNYLNRSGQFGGSLINRCVAIYCSFHGPSFFPLQGDPKIYFNLQVDPKNISGSV